MNALSIEVRLSPGGPAAAVERVTRADLADARSEAWFSIAVRRGRPDLAPADLPLELEPIFRPGDEPFCTGFALSGTDPGGARRRLRFGRECLAHVASRAAKRLVESGALRGDAAFGYDLRSHPGSDETTPRTDVPLVWRSMRLAPLVAAAHPVRPEDAEDLLPVLVTDEARRKAESIARRGAALRPPIETGGLLLGELLRCEDSGEMALAVTDALEATGARSSTFSLEFSGLTWSRLRAVLRAMRSASPALIPCGQFHGHPFGPGCEPCAACATAEVCGRHTAVLSEEDRVWCRSVFPAMPYQVSWIFGANARGEAVDRIYGQRGGRLEPRGWHAIPALDPAPIPAVP